MRKCNRTTWRNKRVLSPSHCDACAIAQFPNKHPPFEVAPPAKHGSPHHWQLSKAGSVPGIAYGYEYDSVKKAWTQEREVIQNHANAYVRTIGQVETRVSGPCFRVPRDPLPIFLTFHFTVRTLQNDSDCNGRTSAWSMVIRLKKRIETKTDRQIVNAKLTWTWPTWDIF
jgi:hypothetical protein